MDIIALFHLLLKEKQGEKITKEIATEFSEYIVKYGIHSLIYYKKRLLKIQ
jgi:hypothetical protein